MDQYRPDLVKDNERIHPPYTPEEGYHLSEDAKKVYARHMEVFAGFLDYTEGELELEGKPIRKPGPDRGVVFQNTDQAIFQWKNVWKNVEYGLKMQHVPRDA